jgi:type IV secretory pathway TrbD component
MACTDIFWHEFYKGAGVTLGLLLSLILGFGAVMWAVFRQLHRHEEAMQEARMRESQVRESHYRVIQGGQG